ncbi:hypothetical protein GCM10011506_29230 [Marivirga lumbricoides]|uniref:SMP-30/Gluconolactonase/LRE-like region domain-containing protein n=2 Tax=Marivirga lumbricoides TaxID=1046115 RepID=A0ABQ1MP72_9BACT|nr:hypothetical protein GCM10011506_29230 [Marivirga lumbricoides]
MYPSFLFSQKIIELGSLPEILSGSSGLEFSKSGNIWTINDHGKPVLYQLTKDSFTINKTVYLNNKIKDWEDLTSDDHGNFYIGDFGNNDNNRTDLKIYIIPDPDSIAEKIYTAKIIRFKLSDQKTFPPPKGKLEFDIEAMIHFNGNIYLFSKSRGNPFKGQIKVYKLTDQPGEHIAQLKDTFYTGEGLMLENWITGATISRQNGILALLSHNKIFFFSCFKGDDFFNGNFEMLPLDHFSQKEAIDFDDTQGTYLITDELTRGILGGKIYSIAIPDSIYNCD